LNNNIYYILYLSLNLSFKIYACTDICVSVLRVISDGTRTTELFRMVL